MKILILLSLIFISTISLLALQPTIKIAQLDGSSKTINISDINEIVIQNNNNNNVLEIFGFNKQVSYYPVEVIKNIQFDGSQTQMTINYVNSSKAFNLSQIDSIIIVKDNFQPITIGKQVWMLKNLNVDTYKNGVKITHAVDSATWISSIYGAWCYYNNDSTNGAVYGKLYNWYAVFDPRGLAPKGWHIPSNDEWDTLVVYLGSESVTGTKCKETGTKHWIDPNKGATNECGFTALPGGYRADDCSFGFLAKDGLWWSSTKYDVPRAWAWLMFNYSTDIIKDMYTKEYGLSVRCIKD